jgi:hypothetical protein
LKRRRRKRRRRRRRIRWGRDFYLPPLSLPFSLSLSLEFLVTTERNCAMNRLSLVEGQLYVNWRCRLDALASLHMPKSDGVTFAVPETTWAKNTATTPVAVDAVRD